MTNLSNTSDRITETKPETQTPQTGELEITKSSTPEPKLDKSPTVKRLFPTWQVTVPLAIVSIFMMGSLTTYFMAEGRFLFDLSVSWEQITVRVDADKRVCNLNKEKDTTSSSQNIESAQ